jgi:hypothetical protein
MRFIFDSRAVGSSARRTDAPKRTRGNHALRMSVPGSRRRDFVSSSLVPRRQDSPLLPLSRPLQASEPPNPRLELIATAESSACASGSRWSRSPAQSGWSARRSARLCGCRMGFALHLCSARRPRLAPFAPVDRLTPGFSAGCSGSQAARVRQHDGCRFATPLAAK